jgi:hypothetical protein
VRILAAIARAVLDADARERLLAAHTREATFALLDAAASNARAAQRAPRASLADI